MLQIKHIFYYIHLIIVIFSDSNKIASSQSVLDTNGDMSLKWTVNYSLRQIKFQLMISDKTPMFNWIAIGFSDYGEYSDADACLLWTDYKGKEHFEVLYNFYTVRKLKIIIT